MINIYCDESCHLENDNINVMAIGGIACPDYAKDKVYQDIKKIKVKNNIPIHREIKWNKVSQSKLNYYEELIKYFFNNELLRFRAVVLPNKQNLNHDLYNQSHDDFYYKMYYYTLDYFFNYQDDVEVYIDIKDTKSKNKVNRLKKILLNKYNGYEAKFAKIQQIRSHENSIIQLTDLLLGALTYINRDLKESEAKLQLCSLVKSLSRQRLKNTTPLSNEKFNILVLDRI